MIPVIWQRPSFKPVNLVTRCLPEFRSQEDVLGRSRS